jgi:superfamily II DNA or RNA helicase
MTNIARQIVSGFEEAGMTPEELSADLEIPLETVKLALVQGSRKYNATKEEKPDVEIEEFVGMIKNIARTNEYENPHIAYQAAKWIVDHKNGRLDAKAGLRSGDVKGINILIFNEQMEKARSRMEEMKRKARLIDQNNVIDVKELVESK